MKKLTWFVFIWLASVTFLGMLSFAIKIALGMA
ncbi:DUF2474 domain-containing protein [Vibrio pectenicida]|uniref:DUF2474 domain-containing protein n=1 Tax=Vibrio pectenicida TaxID=62763 RepID=A0A3R9E1L5_9VIBR|nr:DUF2474 domain-containing protein [Vibrio pectenicida]